MLAHSDEDSENRVRRGRKTTPSTPENAGAGTKRRTQYCTFCKNHKKDMPKKGHVCEYKDCTCPLCELLRKAQLTMRHQQRVWRHQKFKLQQANGGTSEELAALLDEKGQVCDKCRNHNQLILKKTHKCPFDKCSCQYCSLTFKRRELMKHLQRVRRSNLTSEESMKQVEERPYSNDSSKGSAEENVTNDSDEWKASAGMSPEICDKGDNFLHSTDDNSLPYSGDDVVVSPGQEEASGQEEEEEEPSSASSPFPNSNISSPPPLIPISSCPRTPMMNAPPEDYVALPQRSEYDGQQDRVMVSPLPPTTSHPQEETILEASTRILSRIGKLSPMYCRQLQVSSFPKEPPTPRQNPINICKPLQRWDQPQQDYGFHHWQSSTSFGYSRSAYNNAIHEHTRVANIPPTRDYPLGYPIPSLHNTVARGNFPSRLMMEQTFLPHMMASRDMGSYDMGMQPFMYPDRNYIERL